MENNVHTNTYLHTHMSTYSHYNNKNLKSCKVKNKIICMLRLTLTSSLVQFFVSPNLFTILSSKSFSK